MIHAGRDSSVFPLLNTCLNDLGEYMPFVSCFHTTLSSVSGFSGLKLLIHMMNSLYWTNSQSNNLRRKVIFHSQLYPFHVPKIATFPFLYVDRLYILGNLCWSCSHPSHLSCQNFALFPLPRTIVSRLCCSCFSYIFLQLSVMPLQIELVPLGMLMGGSNMSALKPYLWQITFDHMEYPDINLHLHLYSKTVFMVLKLFIPSPPSSMLFSTKLHLSNLTLCPLSPSFQKKILISFSNFCSTPAGAFNMDKK